MQRTWHKTKTKKVKEEPDHEGSGKTFKEFGLYPKAIENY